MLELRILNGLHRGATLPLDAQAVNIGAGEAADVVMADHGIEDDHAHLAPHGDGWLLSSSGGAVYAADHSDARELVELQAGECARVGDIWLCIDWQDAPWQPPPPLPAPEPQFDARAAAEEAPAETPAETAADTPVPPPRPRGHWRRRSAGALVAAVAAMLAATAYALTTRAPLPAPAAPELRTLDHAAPRPAPKPIAPAAAAAPAGLDAAALAALFRKRLTDAELINRFDLTLEPNDWSMQAHLDDDESARFERVLNAFIKEHNITFPVRAKAVTAEAMLPFRIGQVISGANAAVVTNDGARLYVGDDYRGVRLVAIAPSRVTFFGKRKIEVIW
ncbi:hypothetical protein INH39_30320 [Massilia violaceinigra]|uniref:YscD cytoplasmic domain-containing protein n=1 Tax=Massilia violaceinigra TaxID=2045208 RepID=A0ABY4AAL9_9BURK|nr:FHA domain-containing protein [Massilia violaceinigra]UOD29633.1 hypothetical protein INH39_30320 [Massilia violaceinigra]